MLRTSPRTLQTSAFPLQPARNQSRRAHQEAYSPLSNGSSNASETRRAATPRCRSGRGEPTAAPRRTSTHRRLPWPTYRAAGPVYQFIPLRHHRCRYSRSQYLPWLLSTTCRHIHRQWKASPICSQTLTRPSNTYKWVTPPQAIPLPRRLAYRRITGECIRRQKGLR